MILVDTSSWIHFLRTDGQARLCPIVQLELWNGARGKREIHILNQFASTIPELAINTAVWQLAYEMARQLRSRDVTIPATNVLIAACAKYHGASLETTDSDFELVKDICN